MANLKTRLEQLENDLTRRSDKGPLVIFVGDGASPEQEREMAAAAAKGRAVIPVRSIDAHL